MRLRDRQRFLATLLSLLALCCQLWLPIAHTRAIIEVRAGDPLALAFCGGSSPAMVAALEAHAPEALLAVEKTAHLAYAKACCNAGGNGSSLALAALPQVGPWLLTAAATLISRFSAPLSTRPPRGIRPPLRGPPTHPAALF